MSFNPVEIAQQIRARTFSSQGREALVQLFEFHLKFENRSPFAVIGHAGIGKTPFMDRCRAKLVEMNEMEKSGRKFSGFMIDPNGLSTCADFARNVWDGIITSLRQMYGQLPNELELPFTFETSNPFLLRLRTVWRYFPQETFVCFADDFDAIFQYLPSTEYRRVLALMIDIARDQLSVQSSGYLVFFLCLNQYLPQFNKGTPLNSNDLVLLPLEEDGFRQLCNDLLGRRDIVPESAIQWVHQYTGGYPLFGAVLLTSIFDILSRENRSEFVEPDELPALAARAVATLGSNKHLESWFNSLLDGEQYALLWLANNDGFLPHSAFSPGTESSITRHPKSTPCNDLEKRGYLVFNSRGYNFAIQFIDDWLNLWTQFADKSDEFLVPRKPSPISPHVPATGICVDATARKVYVEGREVQRLIPTAYDALLCLARNAEKSPGRVVPKDELARAIRHEQYYQGDDGLIVTVINRVRTALGESGPEYLKTRYKQGYYLEPPVRVLNDSEAESKKAG
ncbi:MAG: winged helix-turn-helix domain-containing protein [Anaerolineae bacterium]